MTKPPMKKTVPSVLSPSSRALDVDRIGNSVYFTITDGGSDESVIRVDAGGAHEIAEWIVENIEKPNPLPTEDGVYIAANIAPDKSPVVFVRYNNTWRSTPTAGDPERLAKDLAARVGLLRLDVADGNPGF